MCVCVCVLYTEYWGGGGKGFPCAPFLSVFIFCTPFFIIISCIGLLHTQQASCSLFSAVFIYRTLFFSHLFSVLYSGYPTAVRPWSCCTALTANFTFSDVRKFCVLFSVLGENCFLVPVLRSSLTLPILYYVDKKIPRRCRQSSITIYVYIYIYIYIYIKPSPRPKGTCED